MPISSGGTAGNPAFIVVGYRDGILVGLLTEVPEEGSVQVQVVNKQLVESVPVYSPGDLPGFPSEIKNIYYAWNGSGFVVAKRQEPSRTRPRLPGNRACRACEPRSVVRRRAVVYNHVHKSDHLG